jgi:hypothetical protein
MILSFTCFFSPTILIKDLRHLSCPYTHYSCPNELWDICLHKVISLHTLAGYECRVMSSTFGDYLFVNTKKALKKSEGILVSLTKRSKK